MISLITIPIIIPFNKFKELSSIIAKSILNSELYGLLAAIPATVEGHNLQAVLSSSKLCQLNRTGTYNKIGLIYTR